MKIFCIKPADKIQASESAVCEMDENNRVIKHETKTCPRCQHDFECKSGSILLCQCQTVYLEPAHTKYISSLYSDCLCASCLLTLRTEYNLREHEEHLRSFMS